MIPGFVSPPVPKCKAPLGLQNNLVTDNQITASSQWNSGHRAANARLYFHSGRGRTGGWSARYNNPEQWIKVDFKTFVKIVAVGTQGREDYNQWVTKYSLAYSRDDIFWTDYMNKPHGKVKLFDGNTERYSVVRHTLEQPIIARFVRIQPKRWHGHISMRAEFYGCTKGFEVPPSSCSSALGMKSKSIPDSKITASSQWDSNHSPARARLDIVRAGHKTGAWSAKANDNGQWIQVDLGKAYKVTRIVTQGRQDHSQWVTKYTLQYGNNGVQFATYGSLTGNRDRNSKVGHILKPAVIASNHSPSRAKLGTSKVGHKTGAWSARSNDLGQWLQMEFGNVVKPSGPNCESEFSLKDSQLSASTEWDKNHAAANAKLHHQKVGRKTGAWSARHNDPNQWLQVDLGKIAKITRVSTQGRADYSQWVKTYTIDYSVYGNAFEHYNEGASKKVFPGNNDRHSVVSHKLSKPIIARYIRFRPQSWHGHISMRVGLYGCTKGIVIPSPKCGMALGLESGIIPDFRMTSSSNWDNNHRAANARLHFRAGSGRTGAWSARHNNVNQWLQLDFGKIAKIVKSAIQGRSDANQWVTKYKLSYSREGVFWMEYPKEFAGNTDRSTVVYHDIVPPIFAQMVRIHPKAWNGHISLRAEFYGCTSGTGVGDDRLDLTYPTNALTEGTHERVKFDVVTDKRGVTALLLAYCPAGYQFTLPRYGTQITAQPELDFIPSDKATKLVPVTQGRQDHNQWVKTYKLQSSLDGGHFEDYNGGKALVGNKDRNTVVGHVLKPAIITRFIRLRPMSWYGHISLRTEFYGCTSGFPSPPIPVCGSAIHLGDWMMSSSSQWDSNHGPTNAKLDFMGGRGKTGGWSARHNNAQQWIKVDFDREMKITRISTRGRHDHNQWVKSFTLEYSQNGLSFLPYKENGIVKVFQANKDRTTIVSHKLSSPLIGLAIRFRPKSWYGHISMRVGVYGCPTGKKPANPPCRNAMDIGIIMDRSGSIGSANFKMSQDFVVKMIRHFEYASMSSRFGIITYNSNAKTIVKFSDHGVQNSHALENLVYGIDYLRGGTRTDKALVLANSDLGYQRNKPSVLFVLTDGKTNRGSKPYRTVLAPLLAKKVKVIAVGVGRGINNSELRQIASNQSKHVFHVKDFELLFGKLNDILKASCPS
ncbi:hypothetical protein QZH41_001586 [Actinostola sp. cb2023]|nr:hypothetical protein QZH41_001586 [Actinostola sp. cb2023]